MIIIVIFLCNAHCTSVRYFVGFSAAHFFRCPFCVQGNAFQSINTFFQGNRVSHYKQVHIHLGWFPKCIIYSRPLFPVDLMTFIQHSWSNLPNTPPPETLASLEIQSFIEQLQLNKALTLFILVVISVSYKWKPLVLSEQWLSFIWKNKLSYILDIVILYLVRLSFQKYAYPK